MVNFKYFKFFVERPNCNQFESTQPNSAQSPLTLKFYQPAINRFSPLIHFAAKIVRNTQFLLEQKLEVYLASIIVTFPGIGVSRNLAKNSSVHWYAVVFSFYVSDPLLLCMQIDINQRMTNNSQILTRLHLST